MFPRFWRIIVSVVVIKQDHGYRTSQPHSSKAEAASVIWSETKWFDLREAGLGLTVWVLHHRRIPREREGVGDVQK